MKTKRLQNSLTPPHLDWFDPHRLLLLALRLSEDPKTGTTESSSRIFCGSTIDFCERSGPDLPKVDLGYPPVLYNNIATGQYSTVRLPTKI